MSEQTGKGGTFYTLTKWFKWFSVILLLIPVALIVINLVYAVGGIQPDPMEQVGTILQWITIAAAALWLILDVILVFAAGTVRAYISPLKIRVWLLIALVLVMAPVIIDALAWFDKYTHIGVDWTNEIWKIVRIFLPVAVIVGLTISTLMATKIKRKLL